MRGDGGWRRRGEEGGRRLLLVWEKTGRIYFLGLLFSVFFVCLVGLDFSLVFFSVRFDEGRGD